MAGGVGSRFWPLSTHEYPKQFIDILGCGRTLIQPTEKHGTLMIRPVVGKSYYIGVEEQTDERPALRLYPNPASSTLHLEGDFENSQVSIYDLLGRKVYQAEYQGEISVSGLNSGLYLLSVVTAEGLVINQKFLIEK